MKYLYLFILISFIACKPENKPSSEAEDLNIEVPNEVKERGLFILVKTLSDEKYIGIEYTIENNLEEDIYLVNQLYTQKANKQEFNKDLVYTDIIDNSLCLYKAAPKVPEGMNLEAPALPYLTKVKSKGNFKELVRYKLPPVPNSPYIKLKTTNTDYVYQSLAFEVGWLPGDVAVKTVKTSDGQKRLQASYKDIREQQQTLSTKLEMEIIANFYKE